MYTSALKMLYEHTAHFVSLKRDYSERLNVFDDIKFNTSLNKYWRFFNFIFSHFVA